MLGGLASLNLRSHQQTNPASRRFTGTHPPAHMRRLRLFPGLLLNKKTESAKVAEMAPYPSGKGQVCKTFIVSSILTGACL